MINSITITNHLDESITLEMRFPEQSGFLIRSIEGLGPSKADINITELSGIDGANYNSARVNSRNIVFLLGFLEKETIEDIRQESYKYFPIKKRVEIKIETDNRISETYGYVESNEPNIFSKEEITTISVICPDSYLYSSEDQITLFSSVISLFEFPFSNESLSVNLIEISTFDLITMKSIYYTGDAPVGIVIFIHAIGSANDVEIINVGTSESIKIDSARLIELTGYDIQAGDDIIISTVKGNKYAILIREGVTINILNVLDQYPDWFELEKGDNVFSYTADSGVSNLQIRIENKIAYEGI